MSFVRLLAIFRSTLSPSKMTLFLVRPNRQMRITLRAKRETWVAADYLMFSGEGRMQPERSQT
jgi:hypothetical protein